MISGKEKKQMKTAKVTKKPGGTPKTSGVAMAITIGGSTFVPS